MEQPVESEWRMRTPMLAALGLVAGMAAWLLVGDDLVVSSIRAAALAFVIVGAMAFGFVVERARIAGSVIFALACGVVAALILYWNGPTESWSASEGWRLVALVLALGIAAPLFQSWEGPRPVRLRDLRFDYVRVHDHAWTNAVLFASGWAFVGIVLLLTMMLSGLFELIGIKWIEQLMNTRWFPRMLVGAAYGTGLGLLREQGRVVGLLQRVVMTVLGVLAPVFAVGLAFFLVALPLVGFAALWDGWASAAALMLGCMIAAVILANAVIGNRPEDEARNPALRFGAMLLAIVMLPLAVLASVAIGMRIGQYGFTPDRLWALTFAVIASAYGVAYFGSVVLGRMRWAERVRPANLRLALATCVVALILATPLPSFNALATRDQVARLESGRVAADQFDWAALKHDFGSPGRAALARLAGSADATVREAALKAQRSDSRWELAEQSRRTRARSALAARVRVVPQRVALPPGLIDAFVGMPDDPVRAVVLYRAGSSEAALIQLPCDRCAVQVERVRRGDDGQWKTVRTLPDPSLRDDRTMMRVARALDQGRVEILPIERRQVFVDGVAVGEPFE